jgi:hypothetical protein
VRENTKNYRLKKAREVKLMAKPIPATPVLEGQDAMEVLKELQRPDKAKEIRMKAVESLKTVSRPGYRLDKV